MLKISRAGLFPWGELPARLFGSALTDDLWEIYRIFIPAKFSNFVE